MFWFLEQFKKNIGEWWFLIMISLLPVIFIVFTITITTITNYIGLWGHTTAECKIFENSYQYKAGKNSQLKMLKLQKAIIEQKLNNNIDSNMQIILQEQLDGINVQLGTISRFTYPVV